MLYDAKHHYWVDDVVITKAEGSFIIILKDNENKMRGLRKQESLKFERFFAIVEKAAATLGCVFFADAGDGNDFETEEYEGKELMGWLIPMEEADAFEPFFLANKEVPDKWEEAFCWAEWTNPNNPTVKFVKYGS